MRQQGRRGKYVGMGMVAITLGLVALLAWVQGTAGQTPLPQPATHPPGATRMTTPNPRPAMRPPGATSSAGTPNPQPCSRTPSPPAGGKVYYISAMGSDSNSGTDPAHPWQTFANVTPANIVANSLILARAGDKFSLTTTIVAPTDNLTFGMYGCGAKPIIVAPATVSMQSDTGAQNNLAFRVNYSANITLQDWEITAVNCGSAVRLSGGQYFGVVEMKGTNFHINRVRIHDVNNVAMYAEGGGGLIENSEFDHVRFNLASPPQCTSATLTASTDATHAGGAVTVRAYVANGDSTVTRTVQYNTFHDIDYRALEIDGSAFLVQNNTFTNYSKSGIQGGALSAPGGIYVTMGPLNGVPSGMQQMVGGNTLGAGAGERGGEWVALWADNEAPAGVVFTSNIVVMCQIGGWSEKTNGTVFTGNTFTNTQVYGVQWGDYNPSETPPSIGGAITSNTLAGTPPIGMPPPGAGGYPSWIVIDPPSTVTTLSGNTCNGSPCHS